MPQSTNYTPISLYYSSTATNVPSSGNLVNGELALNIADMKLYAKNSSGVVTLLASNSGASATVSSVAVSGGTTGLTTSGGPITTSGTITFAGTLIAANGGTGFASYTTGDMLYASGATTISKLALGTTNYVLTAGASGPQYVAQSTLAAGSANNLAGGSAGATPYQTGSGATSFLSLGASGYVLSAGASAPQYVAQSTLSVGTATNLAGGAANRIAYQTGAGATSFTPAPTTSNYVLTWNGTTIDWASVPTVTSAGNLVGGAAGDVVYQSATNVSAFLPDIAVGNALISGGVGVAPSYGKIGLTTHVSGTLPIASGGTNSTATATAGGVGYGTGTAYAFTTAGTTGQALISAGASAPAFGTLGVAGGGTSLTTLTANNVILGNGTSAPLFVAPSTSGNALISNGTTWASQTIPVPSGSQIYTALNFGGF